MTDLAIQFASARSAVRFYPGIFESTESLLDKWLEDFRLAYSRVILCGLVQLKFQDAATKTALQVSLDKDIIIDDAIHALPEAHWVSELIFTFADNIILHNSMADFKRMLDITEEMYEADHKLLLRDFKEIQKLISNDMEPEVIFTDHLWPDNSFLIDTGNIRTNPHTNPFATNLSNTDFWRDWYQGFLNGKPLDWNLQREVALIPDADWDKGPAHIAELIEEIKARFLADKAPLAEKLELNPKTGKFFVTPVPARKPDLLNTTLEKASDALDDALNGRNGLLADDRVARVLRRCFEKYTHNPERIEMDFVDAHAGLTRQMASGELADSEEILSLAEVLKNGALDIRANHPDIAANRETRAARALQELTPEQKQQLADAQPILEALTEDEAHQDMGADIPALINDMIGPIPDYAPPVGPAVRVVNRAAKMSLLASSKEAIEAIEKNSGFRMVRISLVLKSIIDIGLKIFGLF